MSKNKQQIDESNLQNSEPMKPEHETYVDGAMSISLRSGVAKVDFYQALGTMNGEDGQDQKEMRRISQRLVLPVAGLFELNGILEKVLKAIKEADTSQKSSTH